jgi:hypothetical protein
LGALPKYLLPYAAEHNDYAATGAFRVHSFDQVVGKTHIFYPEATPERCTAALLLEINPIGLVRNRRGPSGEAQILEEYVNDPSSSSLPAPVFV